MLNTQYTDSIVIELPVAQVALNSTCVRQLVPKLSCANQLTGFDLIPCQIRSAA